MEFVFSHQVAGAQRGRPADARRIDTQPDAAGEAHRLRALARGQQQ